MLSMLVSLAATGTTFPLTVMVPKIVNEWCQQALYLAESLQELRSMSGTIFQLNTPGEVGNMTPIEIGCNNQHSICHSLFDEFKVL